MTSRKDFGIKIMSERDEVTQARQPVLDSDKKQLKFREVIDIKANIPGVAAGTGWSKTIQFKFSDYGLKFPYAPMYQYRVKGHNGMWGKPTLPSPQSYQPSLFEFPYFHGLEYITKDRFYIELYINNTVDASPMFTYYAYPAHTLTLRLILMYDELEIV